MPAKLYAFTAPQKLAAYWILACSLLSLKCNASKMSIVLTHPVINKGDMAIRTACSVVNLKANSQPPALFLFAKGIHLSERSYSWGKSTVTARCTLVLDFQKKSVWEYACNQYRLAKVCLISGLIEPTKTKLTRFWYDESVACISYQPRSAATELELSVSFVMALQFWLANVRLFD